MTRLTRSPALHDRLIVALDLDDVGEARRLIDRLGDAANFYKIGYRLAYSGGLALARELAEDGRNVFIDLKLLDIDNTVREGVAALSRLGATCLTVHAYPHAMRAAVLGRGETGPSILGVTVLTSLDREGLAEAGYAQTPADLVETRARQAAAIGIDGLVCSGAEAARVRAAAPDLVIVTPGIRAADAVRDDQARAVTAASAVAAGADYLVVGRPITRAADPREAALRLTGEIGEI